MAAKAGIFMIADSLEVEDIIGGVIPAKKIKKLDRVANLNVVLSFWGTTENSVNNFNLIDELEHFETILKEEDNTLTVSKKIKNYFEELAILDEDDNYETQFCPPTPPPPRPGAPPPTTPPPTPPPPPPPPPGAAPPPGGGVIA